MSIPRTMGPGARFNTVTSSKGQESMLDVSLLGCESATPAWLLRRDQRVCVRSSSLYRGSLGGIMIRMEITSGTE